MTTTDDLVAWLRTQLAEEGSAAELLRQQSQDIHLCPDVNRMATSVLADVAVKLAILTEAVRTLRFASLFDPDSIVRSAQMHYVVCLIATAYADRDGYREEWRPR